MDLTRLRGFETTLRMPVHPAGTTLDVRMVWDGRDVVLNGITDVVDALAIARAVEGREPGDDDLPLDFPPAAPMAQACVQEPKGAPTPASPPVQAAEAPAAPAASLPADLAPFKLAGKLSEVLEGLAPLGLHRAEQYVHLCSLLREAGACPVLARVPRMAERVVGACVRLGLVSFESETQADAEVARLALLYDVAA